MDERDLSPKDEHGLFQHLPVDFGPEEAVAWHRECSNCGIVLTVTIENGDTGKLYPKPAPAESRCGLCKAEYPGPWVAGEYEDSDDGDETDEMRKCSECDEGYAHSYVCTRCSSESYQNDDGVMCDQKLHEPCRVCDYGTVHALVAPGYEK